MGRLKTIMFILIILLASCGNNWEAHITDIQLADSGAMVQPPIQKGVRNYLIAPVKSSQKELTIEKLSCSSGASVMINNEPYTGSPFVVRDLRYGNNPLTLSVTGRDGKPIEYSFSIYRALGLERVNCKEKFVNNGDGTITDSSTGLIWPRNCNHSGMIPWKDAGDYVQAFNRPNNEANCGFSDWRIPNKREIQTLLHSTYANSTEWMEEAGFVEPQAVYWTSNTYAFNTDLAWRSVMTNAHSPKAREKYFANSILLVRGESNLHSTGANELSFEGKVSWEDGTMNRGIQWPEPRFNRQNDGTIIDNMTGVMWLQDGGLMTLVKWCDFETMLQQFNSKKSTGNAGYSDWRGATIYELESIMNYGVADSRKWLESQGFTNLSVKYWGDTESTPEYHWTITTLNGLLSHKHDTVPNSVWPVRDLE